VERYAVAALLALAAVAAAKEPAGKRARKKPERALRLRAIDLKRRVAVVELSGFSRAPAVNLFTFTDERGRHYVPIGGRCQEPGESGARVCDLELPEGYERHKLATVGLHLGGLHSREIFVPEGQIRTAWDAAQASGEPLGPPPAPDGGS
jgi:hypothetical protein